MRLPRSWAPTSTWIQPRREYLQARPAPEGLQSEGTHPMPSPTWQANLVARMPQRLWPNATLSWGIMLVFKKKSGRRYGMLLNRKALP